MHIKIQRWGNSAAVRLPVNVLKDLELGSGDVLDLNVERGALLMKPVKEKLRFELADLVAQCDLQSPKDSELEAWDGTTQVGNEAW
ncbi:AbrB/MazE/SpoVT family DNA-binding domain-containing protein [Stenotrophomonas maltophilia]|uniref:AbrB/MazE/SpoVT family DNA-binding domain-containing protein n=1 Tax=Stenotrophomonas maltophilia TaxID=40324 RepID=UPI003BF877F9